MIYKINELKNNMCGIYKINYKNKKCYIGQSKNIRRRIYEHNNFSKAKNLCDLKIKEQGKIYKVEILEILPCDDDILNDRERYWIDFYKSNNINYGYNITGGGLSSGDEWKNVSKLKNEEVLEIRKRRYNGDRKCDVYKNYENIISFNGFEKIWLNKSYPNVGKEYMIEKHSISRQEYSSKANSGENNNKHKLNLQDVIDIRNRYDLGEDIHSIIKDYNFVKLITIKRVCNRETWKNV